MEDNHSVCSGGSQGSISLSKVECPHCNQEFQQRAIFNHIRVKHPREMITMTTKKFLDEAMKGYSLCIYWIVKNDFDEEEEVKLYACLSTNKTFKTEERATLHFNKNPNDKKKHIQHAKLLLKEFQKEKRKKIETVNPALEKQAKAVKENNPEFVKALWKGIMFHYSKIEVALWFAEKQQLDERYITYRWNRKLRVFEDTTWDETKYLCTSALDQINQLKQDKEMDAVYLQQLWWKFYLFWSKDLAESLPLCGDLQAVQNPSTMWEESFFFYANKTMPEVQL